MEDLNPYDERRVQAKAAELSKEDRQSVSCGDLLGNANSRRDGSERVELKDLNPYDERQVLAKAKELSKKDRKTITCGDLLGGLQAPRLQKANNP